MKTSASAHPQNTSSAVIQSLQDWWATAGVDLHYSHQPASLLEERSSPIDEQNEVHTPAHSQAKDENSDKTVAEVQSDIVFPDNYAKFMAWLSQPENLIENSWSREIFLPEGTLNPELMIITAFPEEQAQPQTGIFSPKSKMLMENMIKAIGSDSQQCYFAPLAMARSLDGRIEDRLKPAFHARILHLIHLVGPGKIIILGDIASKLFFQQNLLSARKKKQFINHVSSNTESIATFHPRILLERPQFKADAWKDLQLLLRTVDL